MNENDFENEYLVIHPWTRMHEVLRDNADQVKIVQATENSLISQSGFEFLDGSSGLWNTNVGHGRSEVIDAIAGALSRLTYLCNVGIRTPLANELAHLLLKRAPTLGRVMFHSTGTAAVEGAVHFIHQYFQNMNQPKRRGIIAVEGSYHGSSFFASSISGTAADYRWIEPRCLGIQHIPIPDSEAAAQASLHALRSLLEEGNPSEIACFIFEPIMGVAGIIVPPDWWLRSATELCRQYGIKIIADEIATGLGRTGQWFASEGLPVDIITVGKGISGGYVPLAATLISDELFAPFCADDAPLLRYGSTMDGCPAACATGIAMLQLIEKMDLVARSKQVGNALVERLRPLEKLAFVGPVRGRGLMIGIPLVEPRNPAVPLKQELVERIHSRLMMEGVLIHATASAICIVPPLTIRDAEVDHVIDAVTNVLENDSEICCDMARPDGSA